MKSRFVLQHQMVQRPQVRRKHLQQSRFLPDVDHRNLDRAIQSQSAVADVLQQTDGSLQNVVAGQHAIAKVAAATLDAAGHGHLFLAVEQGNLAHLHQVHPHRVVDPVVPAGVLAARIVV